MRAGRKRVGGSLLLVLLGAVACTGPMATPAVDSVTINDGGRSVMVGSTLALTVTVVTRNGGIEAVMWSSDRSDTATVSSTGVVTGSSAGEAQITATSALDASKSDTVTITVAPPPAAPAVLSVAIDPGERSVLVGETLPLSASVVSVGGASESVTWMSHDTGTATVDAAGVVTGLTIGEALITATSVFDPSKSGISLFSVVSVLPGAPARISVVSGDSQTAAAGSAVPIPPTVRVRDTDDNPLPGVSVTFTVTAGDATVAPTTPVTTNADGIAALASWVLGTTAGNHGIRATVTGSAPPISVTFSALGVPGAASPGTSSVDANPTSLVAGGTATSHLTVRLRDVFGNPLTTGGAAVSFVAPSRGSVGTVHDNGNGTYSATYTAGTTAGPVTITPRIGGVNFGNTTTITLTAAPITVTNLDDAGPGSMRQAILDANASFGADTITVLVAGTVTLVSALPPLLQDATIVGPPGGIAISGAGSARVFEVRGGVMARLDGLTISHGSASAGAGILNEGNLVVHNCTITDNAAIYGAGIANRGTLTVTSSVFERNHASMDYDDSRSGSGGAIHNAGTLTVIDSTVTGNGGSHGAGLWNDIGASLTVTRSRITGNRASERGGGIHSEGDLTIDRSTLAGNSGHSGGGGILSTSLLWVTRSTFWENTSYYGGGGIQNVGGSVHLTNTTVVGNTASYGGGIRNLGEGGAVFLTNSTITGNHAYYRGGGIYSTDTGHLNVSSSIVASNTDMRGWPDIHGAIASGSHNLIGSDPGLDPAGLHDNGGPTETIALGTSSPAIDAIPVGTNGCGSGVAEDQRGAARPQGSGCDIGAFELQ
jgi:predicted outer membrane repeat protein